MKTPHILMKQLRKPYVDHALCLLLKRRRMRLPEVNPALLLPAYETAPVTIATLPKGHWAAPTNDAIALMKLAAALEPVRILELGSYRGYSARGLLENAPGSATLTAVDIDPLHGEAYRGTPLEGRIDRRVGAISLEMFDDAEHGSFDLVFVDADHRYEAAAQDTEVALRMVSPGGTVLWHDYANWGWFTGDCGVPELLNELADVRPLAHLLGTNIAIHRPRWSTNRSELDDAIEATRRDLDLGHWATTAARPYA